MEDSVARVLGVPSVITLRDQKISIKEITMRNLNNFYVTSAPFFREFSDGGRLARKEGATGNAIEDYTLFDVICNHSDAFIDACEMTTDASVEFMRDLRPDEFFELAREVVHVNGSFFVIALAPALMKLASGLERLGLELSLASSLRDIGTGTSATMG